MAKTLVSACFLAILFVFTFLAYAAELPPHYPVTPNHHHQGGKQTVHQDGARLEADQLVPSHYRPVSPHDYQGGNQQTVHEDGGRFNVKMKRKSHSPRVETLKVPFTLRPCRSSSICQKRCREIYPMLLLYGKCVKGIFGYRCACVPKVTLTP